MLDEYFHVDYPVSEHGIEDLHTKCLSYSPLGKAKECLGTLSKKSRGAKKS